jgi:hypothetical protein
MASTGTTQSTWTCRGQTGRLRFVHNQFASHDAPCRHVSLPHRFRTGVGDDDPTIIEPVITEPMAAKPLLDKAANNDPP